MPTVLVVDQEAVVRNLVRLALSQQGYAVLDASGLSEVAVLCESIPVLDIDLLIVDHRSGTDAGRAVARKLLDIHPALKILIISGSVYRDVQDEGGILPGSSFLQKPFSPQQLLSTVENILFPKTQ